MVVFHIIFPILNILFSTMLMYGPYLYYSTNKLIYLIITFITTNILIYVIYKMYYHKFSILVNTICGKVIPTIILGILSLFIIKDKKATPSRILGLFVVIIGIIMIVY